MTSAITEGTVAVKRCACRKHEGPNPLPLTEFCRCSRNPDGLNYWCRACSRRVCKEAYDANPERYREAQRRRYAADPTGHRERAHRRYQEKPESFREYSRRYETRMRDQVLDHYGRSCACCGTTDNLSIDHVNGDGKAHRQEVFGKYPSAPTFDKWLIEQGFPDGFQVLCMPCNISKKDGPACRLEHAALIKRPGRYRPAHCPASDSGPDHPVA